MHRAMRPEGLDLDYAMAARSRSISSDKPSVSGSSIMSLPPRANPEPAYIAASAASQLVSSEMEDDGMMVSQPALALLNLFLDHTLYNILSAARSTRLTLLRQAVPEILKPRLGREAVAGADEELREYLGGDEDDEELSDIDEDPSQTAEFDLELAWKLARLRCMVYTRLGDLEEDDEDEYIEQEQLDRRRGGPPHFSSHSSSVTPAAAIFLTSVLEYLGEQALYYAGEAAQRRILASHSRQTSMTLSPLRKVLEEIDMFQVGRDSPLQRLWRTWRRNVRPPTRPFLLDSALNRPDPLTATSSRKDSFSTTGDPHDHEVPMPLSVAQVLHASEPAQSPPPHSGKSSDEMRVSGLVRQSNEIESRDRTRFFLQGERGPLGVTHIYQMQAFSGMQSASPTHSLMGSNLSPIRSNSLPPPIYRNPEIGIGPIAEAYSGEDSEEDSGKEEKRPVAPSEVQRDENIGDEKKPPGTTFDIIPADHISDRNGEHPERDPLGKAGYSDTTATASNTIGEPANTSRREVTNATATADATDRSMMDNIATRSDVFENVRSSSAVDAHLLTTTASSDQATSFEDKPPLPIPEESGKADELTKSTQRHSLHLSHPTKSVVVRDQPIVLPPLRFVAEFTVDHDQSGAQPRTPAPPLTPLREMMEDARSTSDENSSISHSVRGQSFVSDNTSKVDDPALKVSGKSGSLSSQSSQRSSRSSQILGFTHEQQDAPATVSTDAAGAQSAAHNFAFSEPHGSTNISSSRAQRRRTASPQYSSKTQTYLIPYSGSHKDYPNMPPQRSSYEADRGRQSMENLPKHERVLYNTLASENVSAVESPLLPSNHTHDDEQSGQRTSQSTTSGRGVNTVRSNPGDSVSKHYVSPHTKVPMPTIPRSAAAVAALSPSKIKPNNAQPRDPRVDVHTTRDLADYAKSTGPESEEQLPLMLSSRPGKSPVTKGPPSSPQRRGDAGSVSTSGSSHKLRLKRAKPRVEPREPRGLRSDTTSALIDLIREGPPRTAGDHRIPRDLAPFRRTMDSDDINALGSLPEKDQVEDNSPMNTLDSSVVATSFPSSSSSRTGLLNNSSRHGNRSQSYKPNSEMMTTSDSEMAIFPKRKQRRVRDPYAIDMDDDDEVDQIFVPRNRKAKNEEESLVDFLRTTSPPPEMKAQPFMEVAQTSTMDSDIQKKPSNPTMRDRLMRNASVSGVGKTGNSKASSSDSRADGSLGRVRVTNHARAESPHLSQTGSKLDSYRPTKTTYAAHAERNRQRTRAAGQVQSNVPRAGAESSDAIDFAKTNGAQLTSERSPITPTDEAGFGKFFSRRKKFTA